MYNQPTIQLKFSFMRWRSCSHWNRGLTAQNFPTCLRTVAHERPQQPASPGAGSKGLCNDHSNPCLFFLSSSNRYWSWTHLLRALVWLARFEGQLLVLKDSRPFTGPLNGSTTQNSGSSQSATSFEWTALESRCTAMGRRQKDGTDDWKLRWIEPHTRRRRLTSAWLTDYLYLRVEAKHMILLLARHHAGDLPLHHKHTAEGEARERLVLSLIRKRFPSLNGVATMKRAIKGCMQYRGSISSVRRQKMVPLPKCNVTPAWHPFGGREIDCFGQI